MVLVLDTLIEGKLLCSHLQMMRAVRIGLAKSVDNVIFLRTCQQTAHYVYFSTFQQGEYSALRKIKVLRLIGSPPTLISSRCVLIKSDAKDTPVGRRKRKPL